MGASSAEPELLPLPGSEVGEEEPFVDDPGATREPPSTWGKPTDVDRELPIVEEPPDDELLDDEELQPE